MLVLGLTLKENYSDLRNTRVVDVIKELRHYNVQVYVHAPWTSPQEAEAKYGISLTAAPETGTYDTVVIAVVHDEFRSMGSEGTRALGNAEHVLYDLTYLLPAHASDLRL
ncbi:UDP binding domain-containing protein [Haliea sp.]